MSKLALLALNCEPADVAMTMTLFVPVEFLKIIVVGSVEEVAGPLSISSNWLLVKVSRPLGSFPSDSGFSFKVCL